MSRILSITTVFLFAACQSEAEKQCFDGNDKDRLAYCYEACRSGNDKACATENKVGLQQCFTDHNTESCSRMCRYSKSSGKELFCKEYEKLTGKSIDEM